MLLFQFFAMRILATVVAYIKSGLHVFLISEDMIPSRNASGFFCVKKNHFVYS